MYTVGKAQTDTRCRQVLDIQGTVPLKGRGPKTDADLDRGDTKDVSDPLGHQHTKGPYVVM